MRRFRVRRWMVVVVVVVVVLVPLSGFGLWRLANARDFQFFGGLTSAVDTTEKVVALTFDDGPHPAGTAELLAVLAEKDVPATGVWWTRARSAGPPQPPPQQPQQQPQRRPRPRRRPPARSRTRPSANGRAVSRARSASPTGAPPPSRRGRSVGPLRTVSGSPTSGAVSTRDGPAVNVRNAFWNGTIAPGGAVSFGFIGSWTSANSKPTAFTLNGVACQTG